MTLRCYTRWPIFAAHETHLSAALWQDDRQKTLRWATKPFWRKHNQEILRHWTGCTAPIILQVVGSCNLVCAASHRRLFNTPVRKRRLVDALSTHSLSKLRMDASKPSTLPIRGHPNVRPGAIACSAAASPIEISTQCDFCILP
jgi:hypothetical protein